MAATDATIDRVEFSEIIHSMYSLWLYILAIVTVSQQQYHCAAELSMLT